MSDSHPRPSKDPPTRREDEIQEDPAEPMHPSQPLPPPPRFPQEAPPEEEESTGKSEGGGEGASGASMSEVPLRDARPAGMFTSQTLGTKRADANGPRETTHFPGCVRVPGSRALRRTPGARKWYPSSARARRDVHARDTDETVDDPRHRVRLAEAQPEQLRDQIELGNRDEPSVEGADDDERERCNIQVRGEPRSRALGR